MLILSAAMQRMRLAPPIVRAVVLCASLTAILTALLLWDFPPKQYALQAGEVSRVRISAPHAVTFNSPLRTREAQDKAAAAIADVYDPPDPQIGRQQLTRAQAVLTYVDAVRHDPYLAVAEKQTQLGAISELVLSTATFSQTLATDDTRWPLIAREALGALEQVMRTEVRPEQVGDARAALRRFVSRELNTDETALAGDLARGFVVANSLPNPERTAALKDQARRAVAPVSVTIRQDESVLREGEVITPATLEALEQLGLLQTRGDLREIAGQGVLAGLLSIVLAFYFLTQPTAGWGQWRRISLILALATVSVFAAKIMVPGGSAQAYLLPMPAVAMTLALFMGAPGALAVMMCLSLIIGQLAGDTRALETIVYVFAGSAMGAVSVNRIERINAFAGAGLVITLTNWAVMAAFIGANPPSEWLQLALLAGAGLLNSVLSVSLALAGYSLAGHYLDITTPLQLMELSRPTQPLLRQLLLKAPGTYHHTLLISNMAERAAELIGADPLLARVAAYYHDIGKTVQPYFFIENQIDRDNPHDELNDPYESARIVIQHVPDGIALARKHRLPKPIVDVIAQHHGTMLAAYFFHRARMQSPTGEVNESMFRYPGPKPQTRESAIIMLADGAEATVRATRPATAEELDEILQKIFRDRLAGGELDESNLRLRDLASIRQAFHEILQGQFHPRIVYPSDTREPLPEPPRGIWLESPNVPAREE